MPTSPSPPLSAPESGPGAVPAEETILDLLDVIGHDAAEDARWCAQPGYWEWENRIAVPRLERLGYTVCGVFYSTDWDSFGPLMRNVRVEKQGARAVLYYG